MSSVVIIDDDDDGDNHVTDIFLALSLVTPCLISIELLVLHIHYDSRNISISELLRLKLIFEVSQGERINRELKHAHFLDADGNRKRTFCVPGQ